MIDYCILMGWGANIEASKEKYIFSFKNCNMLDYFKLRML